MLLDPVINNYPPATGTPEWVTAVIALISAVVGGGLTMCGQYLADKRRAVREDKIRAQDQAREDVRQWDERALSIASEMIAIARGNRRQAMQMQFYMHGGGETDKEGKKEEAVADALAIASDRLEALLAELGLIAPKLHSDAAKFCKSIKETYDGIWDDVGEGLPALTGWRQPGETPRLITEFSSAVNKALRIDQVASVRKA